MNVFRFEEVPRTGLFLLKLRIQAVSENLFSYMTHFFGILNNLVNGKLS